MKLSYVIGVVEKRRVGALAIIPITKEKVRQSAVAFVDNTNFYTNRQRYQQKINCIIRQYTRLY